MSNNIEAPKGPGDLFTKTTQPFQVESIAGEPETRVSPLGAFSEFIVVEQPGLLAAVRDKSIDVKIITQRQRELIGTLTPDEIARIAANPELAKVAMLDLSFAISALIFSGITPVHEIQKLNAHFARVTGMPEMMTFEKVVSINAKLPFGQMRTFTDGEIGETEKRFYYGHELMDVKMQDTTQAAAQSVDILRTQNEDGVEEVLELLGRGANNMQEFAAFMRSFMRMPKEHFGTFRQYLSQYPDGTRNASGAFIGMPRLNIRLVGLSPKYEEFLDEGIRYFSISEQPDIKYARRLAQQGGYLVAQCEAQHGNPQQRLAKALKQVIEPIRDFRLSHLAAVNHHVPQALPEGLKDLKAQLAQAEEEPILDDGSTVAKGTAGFLPGPLLRNTLRLDLKAIKRLDAILNEGGQ